MYDLRDLKSEITRLRSMSNDAHDLSQALLLQFMLINHGYICQLRFPCGMIAPRSNVPAHISHCNNFLVLLSQRTYFETKMSTKYPTKT